MRPTYCRSCGHRIEYLDDPGKLPVKEPSFLKTLRVVGVILLSVVAVMSLIGIIVDYNYMHDPTKESSYWVGEEALILNAVTLAGALLAGILTVMKRWPSGAGKILLVVSAFHGASIAAYYFERKWGITWLLPIGTDWAVLALLIAAFFCVAWETD